MAKHRRSTLDDMLEIMLAEKMEKILKPAPEQKKEEPKKKGPAAWQIYIFLVLLWPILGPLYIGIVQLSVSTMAHIVK